MSARNFLAGFLLSFLFAVPGTAQAQTPATGNFDGPAELPRVQVKSSLADTPAPGKVRKVHAGDNLEQVLNQAACGDTIQLDAGAVFTGRFVVPDKKCDDAHWIILRTSAPDSALPPEGSRLTPCYAGVASLPGRPVYPCSAPKNVLARLELPHEGSGPLVFAPGANHYRFMGLEISRTAPGKFIADLVYVEAKSTADHLIFDRDWIHGTPQDDTTRGIGLGGSTNVAVVDSYFSDFHCVAVTGSCTDAEAIAGGTGPYPMGPYKIENNFLEASGEVIILGGGTATTTPTDIEIRRNHLFRPLTWNKAASEGFVGGADGHPFIVKNIFELKNGQRVLFENNVLENCWGGFSQAGFAILLTPKSQGKNLCPECLVLDVTIRYSRIRNVGAGFQLANAKSDFGAFPKDGGRYSIHDVLLENVDGKQFQGAGTLFQLSSFTVPLHDISISHITGETSKSLFVIGASADPPKIAGFTFTNNLIGAGQQPMETTGGGPKNCAFRPEAQQAAGVFESCFENPKVAGNVIIGGFGKWPAKNSLAKNHADVRFMAADKDRVSDYHLHPDSRYKKAGTDQKDVGADVDAIESATKDVL